MNDQATSQRPASFGTSRLLAALSIGALATVTLSAVACSSSDEPATQSDADAAVVEQDAGTGATNDSGPKKKGLGQECATDDECTSGICELECSSDRHGLPEPGADPLAGCTLDPGAPTVTVDPDSATDPAGDAASFTLAKALAGFPEGTGKLTANIRTDLGPIKCEFNEAAAPITVANFVGLARGTRPYKADGKWTTGRFFDGLSWHRVIPGFVIQGGDPVGNGTGGPGYDLPEENHVEEPFGTLAQAAGAAPSGSQFYIVVGTGPAPDYNVYGVCSTVTARAIANVPRNKSDRPKQTVRIVGVDIARCP